MLLQLWTRADAKDRNYCKNFVNNFQDEKENGTVHKSRGKFQSKTRSIWAVNGWQWCCWNYGWLKRDRWFVVSFDTVHFSFEHFIRLMWNELRNMCFFCIKYHAWALEYLCFRRNSKKRRNFFLVVPLINLSAPIHGWADVTWLARTYTNKPKRRKINDDDGRNEKKLCFWNPMADKLWTVKNLAVRDGLTLKNVTKHRKYERNSDEVFDVQVMLICIETDMCWWKCVHKL